ncbi:probable disease resistance protein At4g27220 [Neltuma alba]|uniref:probable disease resistance protein At4g27220 n=1 Tax=Neltuma alba TaxID=207710 RepID=UPI0010A3F09F|nr:probable disease resistance protein At4g27220 [Prosopis alba]
MAEIVISIVSKVAEYLVAPISHGAAYFFCFKQLNEDFKKAKQELEVKLEDVRKRTEEAERKTEEIMPSVKKWLDDVNAILGEVQKLQQELDRGRNNSIFPGDPTSWNYLLLFQRVLDFNSRKSTCNHLLEAIKDGTNKMVGLYGMAGSGKTTLAKEVGKKVDELKHFDKVIMAVVSKPPNVLNIQQEIAGQIGLQLQEPTQLTKAQRLSEGLKNKKILIILDDVWSKLRLEDVGIPLNEGCCVLLTTRLHDVCVSMDCESIIKLPLLTEEESWALFKMCVKTANVSMNEFDSIGRQIVDECKGLPIAIVTVGSTLKGKSIQAWKSTLRRLQRPLPLDIEDDLKTPYACVELSYDNLPSALAKSLFILCSMFPEDHEIHIEDLIRFGNGTLKLGDDIHTIGEARNEIFAAIEKLLDSCLLMNTNKQERVKLHDVVRDVALWITKKQHQEVLVDSHSISSMLVSNGHKLNDAKALSLWNLDKNFKIFNKLHCPSLEILLLQPDGFIEDIGAIETLKVLALITHGFQWRFQQQTFCSVPQSIVLLTNLQTLCLRGKQLGDISFLCELKGLEILDLHGSLFNELPAEIADMKMLKLLDIFGCEIEKSPLEVIRRCEQLEELYFREKTSVIPENFSLSRLKRYVIYDSTCRMIDEYMGNSFQEYLDSCDEALRALCIQGFRIFALTSSMKDLIFRANHLWLDNCSWNHKDINFRIKQLVVSFCQEKRFIMENSDMDTLQPQQIFSDLITLRLFKMNSLEQLFEASSISYSLPMLQELSIQSCPELRTCIFPHAMVTSLPKLRRLVIEGCGKVKWLFSYSLASHCPSLEEIIIANCFELERLIDEEAALGDPLLHDMQYSHPHGKETDSAYVGVTAKRFNQLQNQQSLILFLRLKSLKIERSGKKKGILEIQVGGRVEDDEESIKAQEPLKLDSELSELKLDGLPELEYIWKGPTQIVSLHRLEDVSLRDCPKLKSIFTLAIVASLPELRTLEVYYCKEWEGIFCEESLKNLSSSNICFPKLKQIDIWGCHKVRWLLSYSLASHCPSIGYVRIHSCSEFEGLIGEEAAHGDPLLHDMQDHPQQPLIRNCSELETLAEEAYLKLKYLRLVALPKLREIFPHQHENDTARVVKSELWSIFLADLPELEHIWKGPTQILSFHRLEDITLWECPRLRNIFTLAIVTSLPELRKLDVRRCDEWEGIFCEESLKNLSTTSTVCFPKLEIIEIIDCHKVRRVFSYSLASHCPSLKKLHIWDCCQLEGVVEAYEGEVAAHNHQRLFPELNYLKLSNLPKLREIYEGYEFNLLFGTITIEDCPNISKISKIPLEDKPSSSGC